MGFPLYTKQRDPDHSGSRSLGVITGIVLHYTYGNNPGDKATIGARDPRRVSAHYFIPDDDEPGATDQDRAGIYEFVPLTTVAHAVGRTVTGWGNEQTVSIEIGNNGRERPTPLQLEKLNWLIDYIDGRLRRTVPIRSHEEIALPAGRKAGDPNGTFPLANYKTYRRDTPPWTHRARRSFPLRYGPWSPFPMRGKRVYMNEGLVHTTRSRIGILGPMAKVKTSRGLVGWMPAKYLVKQ